MNVGEAWMDFHEGQHRQSSREKFIERWRDGERGIALLRGTMYVRGTVALGGVYSSCFVWGLRDEQDMYL